MAKTQKTISGYRVEIRKNKGQKNVYLRVVPPRGRLVVSGPSFMRESDVARLIGAKRSFIERAREKFASLPPPRSYEDGEVHYLWGRPLTLKVKKSAKNRVEVSKGEVYLFIKEPSNKVLKEKIFREFYRKEIKDEISRTARACEKMVGASAGDYRVRLMKTRWGSCNITRGRIWLNLRLAAYPKTCLYYVICHELVHLLERDHTKRFYSILRSVYPRYKEAERELEKFYWVE